jgi:hypothetical protein
MAHWYVVGASPDRLAEIREADHLIDSFDGPLDHDDQTALYRRIANAAPDGLWIAWSSLEPPEIDGLRRLRVAQPSLNIIIEIPADLTPPNPDLAQVVGMGICAIVPESSSFATVTARSYTYADVAAWQGPVRTFDEPDPEPKERIIEKQVFVDREKIVEKKIATSSRPTVIAVSGALPGAGTTTITAALAAYLGAKGFAVAAGDYAQRPALSEHEMPGVTVFASPAPSATDLAARREYAYIVGDYGCADWATVQSARPDLVLWILPGDSRRLKHAQSLPEGLDPDGRLIALVGPGQDPQKALRAWDGGFPAIAWESESERIETILASVLPDVNPRIPRLFPRKRVVVRPEPPPVDPDLARMMAGSGSVAIPPWATLAPPPTRHRRHPWRWSTGLRWTWNAIVVAAVATLGLWLLAIGTRAGFWHVGPRGFLHGALGLWAWEQPHIAALVTAIRGKASH